MVHDSKQLVCDERGEAMTTKMSTTRGQIEQGKSAKGMLKGSNPLKFRSFGEFYRYYAAKKSCEDVSQRKLAVQPRKYKVTVMDKKGKFKAQDETEDVLDGIEHIVIHTSDLNSGDSDSGEIDSSSGNKPKVSGRKSILNGRVKKLCEIFQKAHCDLNYKTALKHIIAKNKLPKDTVSSRPQMPSDADPKGRHPNTWPQSPSTKAPNIDDSYKKRDGRFLPAFCGRKRISSPNAESTAGSTVHPGKYLEPITKIHPAQKTDKDSTAKYGKFSDTMKKISEMEQIKDDASPVPVAPLKYGLPCELLPMKLNSLPELRVKIQSETAEDSPSQSTAEKDRTAITSFATSDNPQQTLRICDLEPPNLQAGNSPESYSGEFLDDMLDRLLNDVDFCSNFPAIVESMSTGFSSKSEMKHFSKIIDEIQLLVTRDVDSALQPEYSTEQDGKIEGQGETSAFDWFFRETSVFEADISEFPPTASSEHNELIPEDLRIKNMDKFRWIGDI